MAKIQKWVIFTLISIIIIAIILRLIKLYEFALWGSDSGEHYFLINQFVDSGAIQLEYNGWGFTYPHFPGMQLFSSGFALSGNISSYHALVLITPIVSALSVIMIFCIAYRVFRDPRIGLVAAGMFAVVLPHVYASSHPMPGTLGSFFLLVCIFLLLKTYDNLKIYILLIISSIALVVTHHMTTYFLIISLTAIILMRELLQYPKDLKRTRIDMWYLTFLISISIFYWYFYAVPFRERILSRGFIFADWLIIPLTFLTIAILWLIIYFRRKHSWRFRTKFFTQKNLIVRIILFNIVGFIIIGISTVTVVPGTNMQISAITLPLFVPIITLMSFISAAPTFCIHYKDGMTIVAWLIAIMTSIIFAFITRSQELLLYRHIPYAFEPIAILTGVGAVKLFDMLVSKQDTRIVFAEPNNELIETKNNLKLSHGRKANRSNFTLSKRLPSSRPTTINIERATAPLHARISMVGLLTALVIICGVFSYPPLDVVSGFEEGTTQKELESCIWAREHLDADSTVASDHRMSSMLFGFANLNSSWEYAPKTFHGESYSEIQAELQKASIPSGEKRIDYVLITKTIEQGVTLEQWENAQGMSDAAIKKFDSKPFIKLYDNGEARLYFVND